MRGKAVIAHKLLEDEGTCIRKVMTNFSTKSASISLQMEDNCFYNNIFLVLRTLEAHSITHPAKPLVTGTDGKVYPTNPSNGFISRFPDDFTGCLGWGSTEHRFRGCPRSNEKKLTRFFWARTVGSHSYH